MLDSIISDIKHNYRSGHMITRLIMINIAVYMFLAIFNAFAPTAYATFSNYIYLPSDFWHLLTRPWTWLTHMFSHVGLWHVAFNMLILYWFGTIMGDLLGDRRVLPLYLLGGLAGGVAYVMAANLFSGVFGGTAHGASAAVLCIVAAAAMTAPDYQIRLLFLGNVKLKWIALAYIFFNILSTQSNVNTGGAYGHLGGLAMGLFYVYMLRQGTDLTQFIQNIISRIQGDAPAPKSKLKVSHKAKTVAKKPKPRKVNNDLQSEVDRILEKIKKQGYDSLTDAEKETLFTASKKD